MKKYRLFANPKNLFNKKKRINTVKKGTKCLNCGENLDLQTNYCPNCGQVNDQRRVSVIQYLSEFFAGFFSFDNRFMRTLIPLIFKPGKVTREYIEGKRTYYANPFRMYLSVSIVFFLLVGFMGTIDDLKAKKTYDEEDEKDLKELDSLLFSPESPEKVNDSIAHFNDSLHTLKKIDTLKKDIDIAISFDSLSQNTDRNNLFNKIDLFVKYDRKNNDVKIDDALSDLGYENNFWNHFYYTRAQNLNKFLKDEDYRKTYADNLISKLSIAIFFLLPVFTFFVWLFYLKKPYNYSEHMVFVFQVQTVLFFFLMVDVLVENLTSTDNFPVFLILLFLLYLYLSMKRFYKQGWFVTLVKMLSLNFLYLILAVIGGGALTIVTFLF